MRVAVCFAGRERGHLSTDPSLTACRRPEQVQLTNLNSASARDGRSFGLGTGLPRSGGEVPAFGKKHFVGRIRQVLPLAGEILPDAGESRGGFRAQATRIFDAAGFTKGNGKEAFACRVAQAAAQSAGFLCEKRDSFRKSVCALVKRADVSGAIIARFCITRGAITKVGPAFAGVTAADVAFLPDIID